MSRRMFSDEVTSTDAFLNMPSGSQLLYFHLGMQADDDGFIASPRMVMRAIGASEDELSLLFVKKFLIPFQSGVCVVKHWRINNQIRKDRYRETKYIREKTMLFVRENGAYTLNEKGATKVPKGHFLTSGNQMATDGQPSIGKESIGKESKESTPAHTAREFFSRGEVFEKIRSEFIEKIPQQTVDKELMKFVLYWTEPSASGKKTRWEKQPTFEVKRRLITWFGNLKDYKSTTRKVLL